MSSNTNNKNYYIISQAFKKQAEKTKLTTIEGLDSITVSSVSYTYCITADLKIPSDSEFTYDDYETALNKLSSKNRFL